MMRTGVLSGNDDLDVLVGNGFPRKMITQVYGEPGTGKSTICLLAAVSALKRGEPVIYIDTESFSVDRFSQIAGDNAESLAENLYLFEPVDLDQQALMIHESEKLIQETHPGIILLDSATGLYRTELDHMQETMQRFNRQMVVLLGYAKRYDIPVLISNQVYMDLNRGEFAPLGGTSLNHLCKVILRIERNDNVRRIRVIKHHARPEGDYIDVILVQEGIRTVMETPE
ncbi:DNA repair and recombination protein RadB [Methanospirillum stamsii]|uniref:DNA repair and recombination protein RadB n=1 Tax=Methanospirillum stamsii TaxID=1277351 RepID=A0A2V2N6E3_9EURY|nr:DNA repair and recombination protein RadB [Methanospirillum stamsii]PWR71081.1 DNA repair and recombination protein RadB [Methanospirillum stamsii]